MTPKEKATDLFIEFSFYCNDDMDSRLSAIKCIDEILFALKYSLIDPTNGIVNYYNKVRDEIEKL